MAAFQTALIRTSHLLPGSNKKKQRRDKNHLDKRKGCIRLWPPATLTEGQDRRLSLSLHHFHLPSTVHCISWGQSERAKLVCESLWTKLHISQKAKIKSKAGRNWIQTNALARKQPFQFFTQNNAEHFLLALDETSSKTEHFVVGFRVVLTGKKRGKNTEPKQYDMVCLSLEANYLTARWIWCWIETAGAALEEDAPGIFVFLPAHAPQQPLTSAEWMRMALLCVFFSSGEPG